MTQTKSTRAFRTISEAGDELELQPHVLRFWESKFPQIQPMKRSGGRRFYRPEDIEFLRGIKILLHREKHPIKDVQKLIRIRGHQSVVELGRSVERASRPKDIKETNLVPKRIKPVVKTPKPEPVAKSAPEPVVEEQKPIDDGIIRRIVPFGKSSRDKQPAKSTKVDLVMQEPITRILDVDQFSDEDDDMSIPAFDDTKQEQAAPEPVVEPEPEPVIEAEPVAAAEPDPVVEPAAVEEPVAPVDRESLETAISKLKSLRTRWEKYQT